MERNSNRGVRRLAKWFATVAGVGYVPKAPGTAGSIAGLAIALVWPAEYALVGVILVGLLGVVTSAMVEQDLKVHDPAVIVIDEVVGIWTILVFLPQIRQDPLFIFLALVLFRVFDVNKPFLLNRLGRLPGGWGIMLDDLGAAAYTSLVLWIVMFVFSSLFI